MGKSISEIDKAKAWAEKHLEGGDPVINRATRKKIFIRNQGILHAIHARTGKLKIALIYNLKKMIQTAMLYKTESDKKGRLEIQKVYRFVNLWEYKGKFYYVYIVVRKVTKQGRLFYDSGIIREAKI